MIVNRASKLLAVGGELVIVALMTVYPTKFGFDGFSINCWSEGQIYRWAVSGIIDSLADVRGRSIEISGDACARTVSLVIYRKRGPAAGLTTTRTVDGSFIKDFDWPPNLREWSFGNCYETRCEKWQKDHRHWGVPRSAECWSNEEILQWANRHHDKGIGYQVLEWHDKNATRDETVKMYRRTACGRRIRMVFLDASPPVVGELLQGYFFKGQSQPRDLRFDPVVEE